MKFTLTVTTVLLAIASEVSAVSEWGQCGGLSYTGSTTCDSGLTCVYQNDWYSQCLRVTTSSTRASSTSSTKSSPSSSSTKTSSSSTKASSSTSSTKTSSSSTKTSSSSSASATASGTSKFWFSFGDSYTQTGFDVTGTQPSDSNPFGNPTYPGYTACGSVPNWVDYVATTGNSTIVKVYNHAYGGATIDASLVTPYTSTVKSLVDQTNDFLNYDAPGKTYHPGWTSANSLFSVWIGINDIGNSWYQSGSRSAFNTQLLNRYFGLLQSMYNVGARHFLFLTVPPIYRTPLMLAQSTSDQAAEKVVIDDFNVQLATKAAAFASANSGVTTQIYNTTTLFNTILDNPTAYGLIDATSYGSASNLPFCNNYHPGTVIHQQIAKGVSALIKGTYV